MKNGINLLVCGSKNSNEFIFIHNYIEKISQQIKIKEIFFDSEIGMKNFPEMQDTKFYSFDFLEKESQDEFEVFLNNNKINALVSFPKSDGELEKSTAKIVSLANRIGKKVIKAEKAFQEILRYRTRTLH